LLPLGWQCGATTDGVGHWLGDKEVSGVEDGTRVGGSTEEQ